MSWSRRAVAVPVVLAGLCAPAPAAAAVLDGYEELASRYLTPAPIVPTTVPPSLAPIDETLGLGSTRGGRGYALRLVHFGPAGPDAGALTLTLDRRAG